MTEKQRWTKKRALAAEPKWSQYQQDIFSWVEHGRGNLLINAIAGSGKTKSLEGIVTRIHSKDVKIVMLAFNTHIRDELAARVPSGVKVATAHGYGHGMLKRHFSGAHLNLDHSKYRKIGTGLIRNLAIDPGELAQVFESLVSAQIARLERNPRSRKFSEAHLMKQAERSLKSEKRNAIVLLGDMARLTLTATDEQSLKAMACRLHLKFKCDLDDVWVLVDRAIAVGNDQAKNLQIIDFTDMIFLPHVWHLQPTHKDFLLVDEIQDANEAQLSLYKKFAATARVICVGDPDQAIQGFAGSTPDMWDRIREEFKPTELPLSVCYRCPTSHLDLARYFVPGILPRPDAIAGEIEILDQEKIAASLQPGDLVLSRAIAPLVDLTFALQVQGTCAKIRGTDAGAEITSFIETNFRDCEWGAFLEMGGAWVSGEMAALLDRDEDDKADSLRNLWLSTTKFYKHFCDRCAGVSDLISLIEDTFTNENLPIVLSTIHRSKGDEADRVFLLNCDRLLDPEWLERQLEWEQQQERNLVYVALTRAKQKLILCPEDSVNISAPLAGLRITPIALNPMATQTTASQGLDFTVEIDESSQTVTPRNYRQLSLIDLSEYDPSELVGSHSDNLQSAAEIKKSGRNPKYDPTWDMDNAQLTEFHSSFAAAITHIVTTYPPTRA